MSVYAVDKLISQARHLAAEYRRVTGRPLAGISGEIAEHDAARLLDLDLCVPKPGGYDAIGRSQRAGKRIQIKGRTIFDEGKSAPRVGQLKTEMQWDSVVLVLLDENLEPYEIYEAERAAILSAVAEANQRRSKRGLISVAKFKNIGCLAWTRENGIEEEVWANQQVGHE